jgi:SAM-dependent methyltransferase
MEGNATLRLSVGTPGRHPWQAEGMAETDEFWSRRRTAFGSAAQDYANGRPYYPREALEWCAPAGATSALDLGAGTGILTAGLLDLGLDVTSVEPLGAMRALIPSGARALDGNAEAIPLADASVDAVFVGQAWHWFDPALALVETRRVLRPGGTMALMWNLLDTDYDLSRQVADIIEADERSDMMLDGEVAPPYQDDGHFAPAERRLVRHSQDYDADRVVAFAVSRSQSILRDETGRQAMVDALRAASPDGPFSLHWICEAWRAVAI